MTIKYIDIEVTGLDELIRGVNPKIVQLANFRAVKRTRVTLAKIIRQKVAKRFFVKQARVTADLKRGTRLLRRSQRGNRAAIKLSYFGKRLNLASFGKPGRKKVMSRRGARYQATTRVLRGGKRKRVAGRGNRGGFLGTGPKNGRLLVFERTGVVRGRPRYKGDEKLRSETGPAVAQMIRNVGVLDEIQNQGAQRYMQVMQQELAFRLNKVGRRRR